MAYKYEWKPSPNYTPAAQVPALYGRKRVILFGAGHWWNTPEAGATHDGTVATLRNRARQASAHDVISKGRVTGLVRKADAAWATNNANAYVYAIEVDPRIMWRWTSKNAAKKALGNAIFETTAERIARLGMHKLTWKPHKAWWPTACNPIKWGEVMTRAKQIYAKLHAPKPKPKPKPAPKPQPKPPVKPEWQRNLKDIKDIKLMVLKRQTLITDLNNLKPVKTLGQGTWVDFAKQTTVKGKVYLLSNYSIKNAIPNGILKTDVGLPPKPTPKPAPKPAPVKPPKDDKPEWLKNWRDIKDTIMYTRADAPLVNLLDGKTITVIKRGKAVEIASATDWHGQEYMITKYSTDKKEPRGIMLVDLDLKKVKDTPAIPPAVPTDDLIKENNGLLKAILAIVQKILGLLGKK